MSRTAPFLIAALMMGVSASAFAETSTVMAKPDSDMQKVLDAQAALKLQPIETLSAAEARKQPTPADGAKAVMKEEGLDPTDPMGVTTKDMTYKAGAGTQAARVYIPEGADPKTPLPVIVYYHGGGFVIADINVYDATPRSIAKQANAIVVSAEYRHAPENKFPAAFDDAFAAYQWTLENAPKWGGDPKRVAVMGESAGGALALATSVKARDSKIQLPVSQVLVYPIAGVDMTTPSYVENANAKPLNKAMMGWFVKNFINSEKDLADPRIDALGKADLKGLPSTTIVLAQIDPLRSDGEMLADKLTKAGVSVRSETYEGATHEFFGMAAIVDDAKEAQGFVVDQLKSAFDNKSL